MSLYIPEVHVDTRKRQVEQHGDAAFPLACYQGDLVSNTVSWHWHDELELILIIEGEIVVGVGTATETLSAKDACFINAGILHSVWRANENPCSYHSIVFHPRLIGSMESIYWTKYICPLSTPNFPPMIHFFHNQSETAETISLMSRAWQIASEGEEAYEIEVRYLLTEILRRITVFSGEIPQKLSKRERRDMERMKQMLSWLEEHFSENVTVTQIAQAGNVSESECLRCFKRNVGLSPIQYLVRYRLRQVVSMMKASRQSISEVAFSCGFQDMSYFSKVFKAYYSMTPTAYKAKYR